MRVGARLVEHPGGGAVGRFDVDVADVRDSHVRVRFQAERNDGHADEEHGHHTDDLWEEERRHEGEERGRVFRC